MKLLTICILLFSLLQSCNSQTKNNKEKQQNTVNTSKSIEKTPFDLMTLKLNEPIDYILGATNSKFEDNEETEALTLFGYKKFESTSSRLLHFNDKELNDKVGKNTNNLIFHYNEEDNILAMYQLTLFSLPEINTVMDSLIKVFGKPYFETEKSGNLENAIEGKISHTDIKYGESIYAWESNNLIYFCSKQTTKDTDESYLFKLFVLKKEGDGLILLGL